MGQEYGDSNNRIRTCFSYKEGVTLSSEAAAVLTLFSSLATLRSKRRMKTHNPTTSTATTVNAPIMKASNTSTAISNCCDQNPRPLVGIILFNLQEKLGFGFGFNQIIWGFYNYDFTFSLLLSIIAIAPYFISSFNLHTVKFFARSCLNMALIGFPDIIISYYHTHLYKLIKIALFLSFPNIIFFF